MLRRGVNKLLRDGPYALWSALRPYAKKHRFLAGCIELVRDKHGLEIGGPSTIFKRDAFFPVYSAVALLDNCNFSNRTVWEGSVSEAAPFCFDAAKPPGRQFIREATDLHGISDGSYECLLSCHTLEHLANPIKALHEWKRVTSNRAVFIVVVPHQRGTFDHRRPVSTLSHLKQDFAEGRGEEDLTHLDEILRLHDVAADPGIAHTDELAARARNNAVNRCLHHHVFDEALLAALLADVGLDVLGIETFSGVHIVAMARKLE